MRENWTDERLEDLNAEVDRLDDKVERLDGKSIVASGESRRKWTQVRSAAPPTGSDMVGLRAISIAGFGILLAAVLWA